MINKFRDTEKKLIHIERKPYIFYTSNKRNLTFYVDNNDNILDVYDGTFDYLDGSILTITDGVQHCTWYDINTGESLFKEFTKKYSDRRCQQHFENGIALVYNDKLNSYEVLNNNGNIIGLCDWLHRVNKNVLLVKKYRDGAYSLLDYNFNIIKEDLICSGVNANYNKDYILAVRQDLKKAKKYYIVNTNGDKISDEYDMLTTKNFITFKFEIKKDKKKGSITLDELLINTIE